jgi:hypothetical protein
MVCNEDALSRAIRRPAVRRTFLSRLALYGLRGTAASFDVGRQLPGPDYPRSVATKFAAKSADALLPITSTNSGGLARQRLSPYLFSKPVCPLCTGSSENFIFYAECFHSTQEVSEWRCHRHEYRADL